MPLAAGLDFGGSAVKGWVAELGGDPISAVAVPVHTLRPQRHAAEFDPEQWWGAARAALTAAVARAGRPAGDYAGVTAGSLRQGFVLTDGQHELGTGVLNSDRRGATHLGVLRERVGVERLYRLTGHWPAPELTLPKLLHLAEREPHRWAAARRLLFVHDWALWRLCGEAVTEVSYACAGQLADVRNRRWTTGLLDELGLGTSRLAPLVEAGTVVGRLRDPALGLPLDLPVVSGGGDTQLAAMGVGGLADGVVTVVAGSSTPVIASTAEPPEDPQRHPWVSTHLAPDRWAVETNAGYPGTMAAWAAALAGAGPGQLWEAARRSAPGAGGVTAVLAAPQWSEAAWATKAPHAVLGMTPATTTDDLARAVVEAHAYAVRANVDDLERVLGRPAERLVVTGAATTGGHLPRLLAEVLGRDISVPAIAAPAAAAGAALVARAIGAETTSSEPPTFTVAAGNCTPYAESYPRYLHAHAQLRAHLPEAEL